MSFFVIKHNRVAKSGVHVSIDKTASKYESMELEKVTVINFKCNVLR